MGSCISSSIWLSLKDEAESQQVWELGLSCLCPSDLGSKARKKEAREKNPSLWSIRESMGNRFEGKVEAKSLPEPFVLGIG